MRNYYVQIHKYLGKLIENMIKLDKKGIKVNSGVLSLMDIFILKSIGETKEKKMFEMIDELGIDRNTLVSTIHKLQGYNYIEKQKSKLDGRVQVLMLTEEGKDIFEQIVNKENEILTDLLSEFSFNEEKAVLKFLVKLDMLNE